MKNTKRITALVLALLLLVGLAACGEDAARFEVPAGNWTWADWYEGTFSDQGYYYVQNAILRYLDTASGLCTALCTKAGCLHDQESCEAFFFNEYFSSGGACFWEDSLYYLKGTVFGIDLYRCNAIGTDQEKIGSLGKKYVEEQLSVSARKFAQVGSYWYYSAHADEAVLDEKTGKMISKTVAYYISRIDLRTGKEEILIEDRENYLEFCAAQENAVLYTSRGVPQADMLDPAYREQLRKLPVTLHCWDGESKESGVVFEKDGSNFGKILVVVGEKLYYTLSEQKEDGGYTGSSYIYDLKTGKETPFAGDEAIMYFGGEYVKRMEIGTEDWYLYGLESGKRMPIEVSDGYPRMECWTDRGCVVHWQVELETGEKENRTCYVTYEALADGLQDEDMLVFYSSINAPVTE